jgi:hypothetical protein
MNFFNKQVTQEMAVERYGAIDFASAHWPNQAQWTVLLEVPKGYFQNFTIMATGIPVTHILCNRDMATPLHNALANISTRGFADQLLTYDGCQCVRCVRGATNLISTHSYGLAIDLNAKTNGLNCVTGGFCDLPGLVKCFTDEGFDWGGNFSGRKDPMHFSYAWEGK